MPSLADIASQLYAGAPDEFVAARNARAGEEEDSRLASRIRELRKPSIAAWVVNVFAQERSAQLNEALQLAAELREAQADLDAATLATLGRQRRALTAQLAQEAVAVASARGARVTPSTAEAVRQTIAAAFFDPDAALAVASGRLVRELAPAEPVDLDAAVGGDRPTASGAAELPVDEVAARRKRRAAQAGVREAEKSLHQAQSRHADAERERRDLTRRIDDLAGREAALQAELEKLRGELHGAREQLPDLTARAGDAEHAAQEAERALGDAREALRQAEEGA